jgi:hypothetical protein
MEVLLFQEKNWPNKNWRFRPEAGRKKQKRRRAGWRCGVDRAVFQRLSGAAAVALAGVPLHLVRMVQPFAVVSILFPVFRNLTVAKTAPSRISSLSVD